jgi:hypothetical protein
MSPQPPADLDWLAFQYIHDELSADQAEEFEQRMAEDQAAREAVAEAVLLCQAVAAGAKEVIPAGTEHRSWLLHAAWAAIGAAACLALVFVLRSPTRQPVTPLAQRPQLSDLTDEELALVWALSLESPEGLLVDDEDLNLASDTRDAEREVVVPPWMLEALGGSQEVAPVAPERKES